MSKKTNILVIPSDLYGVGHFRFLEPHIEIQKQFPDDFNIEINTKPDFNDVAYLSKFQIIFGNKDMCTVEQAEVVFPQLKAKGVTIIADIDDHWDLHPKHPYYMYMKQSGYATKIQKVLSLVDYVTTTTDYFANSIKPLNKNVLVFPNAINPTAKGFQVKENPSDKVRIGWLGGSTHLIDLQILTPTFASINEKYKNKIQVVLCGFDIRGTTTERDPNGQEVQRKITPEETCWYEYEKIFTANYKYLTPAYKDYLMKFKEEDFAGAQDEQYIRVWTKKLASYALNYNQFDIAIVPLEINKFNMHKSQLKVIEAGFFKKPFVGSEILPFLIDIKDGKNGFLVNNKSNTKNFTYYANKLINDKNLREDMGNALYETVKDKYDLRNVSKTRAEFYKSLIK